MQRSVMKRTGHIGRFIIILFLPTVFSLIPLRLVSMPASAAPTHLDKTKIPGGCGACHKGHGKSATPMLNERKDMFCFTCHGGMTGKKGKGHEGAIDVYSDFVEVSKHPVIETSKYHFRGETLPEDKPYTPRHVSCFDCHNVHYAEKGNPLKGVSGYRRRGEKVKSIVKSNEYTLCYKCHSVSANLPPDSRDISRDFDPDNRSFHPVETIGKGRNVPSLKGTYRTSSMLACSECHGSDDEFGARGPHGSRFSPILRFNYSTSNGPESGYAYELCYECHDRNSILNDDSFAAHKQHIVYGNNSCSGCHNAHGSRNHSALIEFDKNAVSPNTLGQLNYVSFIPGKPRCSLVCHVMGIDYQHVIKDGKYCVNANCPPGW